MSKNQYIFAVARTRVLETKLLTDAFIEQLIAAPDAEQCQRLLTEKGWDEDLTIEEAKTWETVRDLRVPMDAFDVLTFPKLYHNLKAAIKQTISPEAESHAFYDLPDYGREAMLKIVTTKDYSALPAHMQKVAKEAYETYLHTQDGQLCDVMVDKACLEAIGAAGEKAAEKVVRDYAQTTVEVADIKIAVRCAATGKSAEFASKALAKCKGLNVSELSRAIALGPEKTIEYLRKTAWSEAADALEESTSAFERWCDNRMIDTMKPQKMDPFSIGPIFAYAIARQNEIKTVRIILLGKANGLSESGIRERVRKMYG